MSKLLKEPLHRSGGGESQDAKERRP